MLTRSRTLVRDLMQVGVATVPPETLITDITRLMLEKNLEAVIVLDKDEGHALGVVGQEELVQAYARIGWDSSSKAVPSAADVMREGIPQVPPDIPLMAAAQMMRDQNVRTFFLMHHAGGVIYPAASLSYQHVLRHLAAQDEEDLRGLGVEAERKNPIEAFIERRDEARRKTGSKQAK
jgi:CBS domain-containing protein